MLSLTPKFSPYWTTILILILCTIYGCKHVKYKKKSANYSPQSSSQSTDRPKKREKEQGLSNAERVSLRRIIQSIPKNKENLVLADQKKRDLLNASRKKNQILVDDFDKGEVEGVYYKRKNSLGYYQGAWSKRPSYTILFKSETHRRGNSGTGLVVHYKKENGWCGWYSKLGNLNVEETNILSFWVKGDVGGERFAVGFQDQEREKLGVDGVFAGSITQFIPKVTTEWQEVKVPLSRVATFLDLSKLSTLLFEFRYGGEGIVYVEDITFKVDSGIAKLEENNLPTASKSSHPRSMWVWKIDPVLNEKAREQLLKFCDRTAIEIIYLFFGDFDQAQTPKYTKMLEEFLTQSHAQGLKVEALTGNPTWALEEHHRRAYDWLKSFLDFNRDRPESMRIDGVSFDVEPYLTAEWKEDKEKVKKDYLLLMKRLRTLIDKYPEQKFSFGGAIPTFYDDEDNFEEEILKLVDYVALMNYYDTSEAMLDTGVAHLELVKKFNLAEKLGKKIWLGVETQDIVRMKQGWNMNTFYEEGWSFMEKEFYKTYKKVKSYACFGGFAMHCYYAYREMNKEGITPEKNIRLEKPKRDFRDPEFKKGDIYTLYSFRTTKPVRIDGRLDDWDLAYPFDLAEKRQVVYGFGAWKGKEDYSCKVYNAWDENHLYVAFDITDDTLSQWKTGKDMWKGDHIELWLDANLGGDFIEASNSKDDFQIGLSPGNGDDIAPEFYIWTPTLKNKGELPIRVASKKTATGYIIEASIAKEALYRPETISMSLVDIIESEKTTSKRVRYTRKKKGKPPKSFYQGYQMGMMVDASDTDRRSLPQKCLLSTSLDREWGDPTVFGFLELRGTADEEKKGRLFDVERFQTHKVQTDASVGASFLSPNQEKNMANKQVSFVKISDIPKVAVVNDRYIYNFLSRANDTKSSPIYRGKLGSYQLGSSSAMTTYDGDVFFHPKKDTIANYAEEFFADFDRESVRIFFDKKEEKDKNFCGSYISIMGNLSEYKTLTFLIKGGRGGEMFEIGMNDVISHKRDDAVYAGAITRYLPNGLTKDWQLVSIPLEDFYGADLNIVFSLCFLFHEKGTGAIWIDELSVIKKELVNRNKKIQQKGFLLLDNFNHSNLNLLGRKTSTYINLPSSIKQRRVSFTRKGETGKSLQLQYTKKNTGWAGYYTLLNQIDGEYYDISNCDTVSFWVKGEYGGEDFEIGLADKNWMIIGDSLKAGQISKYIKDGITTDWQQAIIPLEDFGLLDLTDMGSLVINFNVVGEGTIYMDDIKFHLSRGVMVNSK